VFVKICGTTSEEDALLAVAMGADALGFIFAPSPRQVSPETVRDIVKRLPFGIITIGVFVNEHPDIVVKTVNHVGLSGAQLHGQEPFSEVENIRSRIPFVIQAFPAGDDSLRYAAKSAADVVLVDSPTPGSGTVFDWSLAEGTPNGVRLLLAGGLTADNVEAAVAKVRPWGVDAVSGVEASKGKKDPTKLRLFIEAARRAGDALEPDDWVPISDPPYDWEADT